MSQEHEVEKTEVSNWSHINIYVQTRACSSSGVWEIEKQCKNFEEADDYIKEYSTYDYQGRCHGQEMRIVEIEEKHITRVVILKGK